MPLGEMRLKRSKGSKAGKRAQRTGLSLRPSPSAMFSSWLCAMKVSLQW